MPTFATARTVVRRERYTFEADSLEQAQMIIDKLNNDEELILDPEDGPLDWSDLMSLDKETDIDDGKFDFLQQEDE